MAHKSFVSIVVVVLDCRNSFEFGLFRDQTKPKFFKSLARIASLNEWIGSVCRKC